MVTCPLLAGMGAVPASMAKAASEWIRPGWDQAHSTVAATMGPMPGCSSRSGRHDRTMARITFSCSAASAVKAWTRRAKVRSTVTVVRVSRFQEGVDPQCGGGAQHRGQLLVAEPRPDGFRGGDDEAEQLLLGGRGLDRGAAGGQQHGQGLTVPTVAWGAEPGPGEGFAGGADRVQRVGLRTVSARGPLRPVELDHDLLPLEQVTGQAGAVAAGALDGPSPQRGVAVGELHQPCVPVGVGRDGDLAEDGAGAGIDRGGGVGVDVGVYANDDVDDLP